MAGMTPTFAQALDTLRASQTVVLQGKPAKWSNTVRVLLYVLIGVVVLLGIGSIVVTAWVASASGRVGVFTIIGPLIVCAMVAAFVVWIRRGLSSQNEYREHEAESVTLNAHGLTLRGVGPIPWVDFGPAGRRLVPAERNSGYTPRAVMELTPSGSVNVNERLAPDLRARLSPPIGPSWNRHHRYIYVPGVEGLSQREVIQLINAGRDMFGRCREAG